MPDGDASILLADASALDRLSAEAGLSSSFFEAFASTTPLHTVGGGDAGGFDRLLASRAVVACDRRLVDPVDSAAVDADRLARYRANFIAKLARRRVIVLAVLQDAGDAGKAALEACRRDVGLLVGAGAPGYCEIILVATGDLPVSFQASIEELRRCPAVGRVYLMTKWLQRGREERHLVLADHVWPLCVGRLLSVRATAKPLPGAGMPAPIMVWRTFAWGTLARSSGLPGWESEYLLALREAVLPAADDPPATPPSSGELLDGDGLAAAPPDLQPLTWRRSAAQLRAAGRAATDPARLLDLASETCRKVADVAARSRLTVSTLKGGIEAAWNRVASTDGIAWLRRIRDGRLWRPRPLDVLTRDQRSRWSRWHADFKALERCRLRHGQAVDELARARARHLPIAWHLIIGMMILPLVFQFIAGVLLPLRPQGIEDGSPLFASPRKAAGSIAYLVDRSSSMQGIRLEKMKSELKAALEALPDGTRFTVVAFNDGREELPIAKSGLVDATTASRTAALDWVDGITASGGTTAVPGLEQLIRLQPDSLIFLTDGLLDETERAKVDTILSDKGLLGDTRVDTVMLYPSGVEPVLKSLAEATGGRFRPVTFDPFAPLGFNRVLAIALASTAAGVLFGAILPWLLERRAGITGTAVLQAKLELLLGDFGRFSESTAGALQHADSLGEARRGNRAWDYQRALAARAFGQLEASLKGSARLQGSLPVGQGVTRNRDPLHAEDVEDFHDILDEPLPAFRLGEQHRAFFRSTAATHAEEIKSLWKGLVTENDPYAAGHLPIHAIAERFHETVGKCLMEASRRLLLPHDGRGGVATSQQEPYDDLFHGLASRIVDDPHRPFLSARVTAPGGKMPKRCLEWIGSGRADANRDLDKLARDYFRQRTQTRFVSETVADDIGLLALGLIHDEFEVVVRAQEDGTLEVVVGDEP